MCLYIAEAMAQIGHSRSAVVLCGSLQACAALECFTPSATGLTRPMRCVFRWCTGTRCRDGQEMYGWRRDAVMP
jgi:hypothetical protein